MLEYDSTANASAIVRWYHQKQGYLWIAIVEVADMAVKPTLRTYKSIPANAENTVGVFTVQNPKKEIQFLEYKDTKGFLFEGIFFRLIE